MLELSQLSGDLISSYLPSELSAAALCLSYKTVKKVPLIWEGLLSKSTGFTEEKLNEIAKRMIKEFSGLKQLDLVMGIKKKFAKEKYHGVSKLPLYTSIS